MSDMTGALMLCDAIGKTENGKYILMGVFSGANTSEEYLDFRDGMSIFARLFVSDAGSFPFTVGLYSIDTLEKEVIMELTSELHVDNPNLPIEFHLQTPRLRIRNPQKGKASQVPMEFILKVQGVEVSRAPFTVFFTVPEEDKLHSHKI